MKNYEREWSKKYIDALINYHRNKTIIKWKLIKKITDWKMIGMFSKLRYLSFNLEKETQRTSHRSKKKNIIERHKGTLFNI